MKLLSIGCMATLINEKYQSQIKGCLETWGLKCKSLNIPVFFFCGSHTSDKFKSETVGTVGEIINLENVGDDVLSATDKQWLGLKWMYENSPSKWYLLTGSDNYLFPDRILETLGRYNYEEELYLGDHTGHVDMYNLSFDYFSGTGFFLSHKALEKILIEIPTIKDEWFNICGRLYWWLQSACDAAMGWVALKRNLKRIELQGVYGCDSRGYDPGNVKCCAPINYNTCLILHRCNYLDHHAIERYHKFSEYQSLYYCYFLGQKDFQFGSLMPRFYHLGTLVNTIYDKHIGPSYISFGLIRGLVDSLKVNKTFVSKYNDELPVRDWLKMASINTDELNECPKDAKGEDPKDAKGEDPREEKQILILSPETEATEINDSVRYIITDTLMEFKGFKIEKLSQNCYLYERFLPE